MARSSTTSGRRANGSFVLWVLFIRFSRLMVLLLVDLGVEFQPQPRRLRHDLFVLAQIAHLAALVGANQGQRLVASDVGEVDLQHHPLAFPADKQVRAVLRHERVQFFPERGSAEGQVEAFRSEGVSGHVCRSFRAAALMSRAICSRVSWRYGDSGIARRSPVLRLRMRNVLPLPLVWISHPPGSGM